MDKFAIRALLQRIAAEQAQRELGAGEISMPAGGQVREGLTSQNIGDASMEAFNAEDPRAVLESVLLNPSLAQGDQADLTGLINSGMGVDAALAHIMRMNGQTFGGYKR